MIETPYLRFTLWSTNGYCEILDKQARVTWRPAAGHARFGEVTLSLHEHSRRLPLGQCEVSSSGKELLACFHPLRIQPAAALRVRVRALSDERTLEFSYQEDNEVAVESITLLEDALGTTDAAKGCVLVPVREGLLVPADSGLSYHHRFDTFAYEGCHMEMLGVVQQGAAALLTWNDPYVAVQLKSVVIGAQTPRPRASGDQKRADAASALLSGNQRLSPSLVLRKSARSFRVQFLGQGDYVAIARAYRQTALDKGWLVTWDQKLRQQPERAKLFGAINFKLWSALDRRLNEASTEEESVRTNWTFDEAAQVAEHLKRDLQLQRVLFTVGGWIHRGYDNQHPDILPAAPECGGDAALAACARRVMDLGYLFCLHDNYQDIYRDSPSWDERLIMRTEEGKPALGGRWAGGRAYLTCSQQALALAQRPQNLPAVKQLTAANAYFIDTTYAAGLQECFDPAHPLTRADDMKWKQALSDYARSLFGVFGSECGREWAIPHSDFFEGLTGVSGHAYHDAALPGKLGATVVPLFDLVYRDCIAMYGKYGYDPRHAAAYVLQHISLARPLNYHSIPPHLYWQQEEKREEPPAPTGADPALFTRADNGWAAGLHPLDRFIKNTYEILSPLNELTARLQMSNHQFLTPDREVARTTFGKGAGTVEVVVNTGTNSFSCHSKFGKPVTLPPYGFLVESSTFVAFDALNWGGVRYESPALFTLRSLDGKPLSASRRVRIFHAFGSDQIQVGKTVRTVPREAIVDAASKSKLEDSK